MKIEYDYTSEISYFKTNSDELTSFKRTADKDSIKWQFKFKTLWFTIHDESIIRDLENYLFPDKTPCEVDKSKFISQDTLNITSAHFTMLESLKALM